MFRNLKVILPMVYGAIVAVVAITHGPVAIVAIVGAVLLGIFYVASRSLPSGTGPRTRVRRR